MPVHIIRSPSIMYIIRVQWEPSVNIIIGVFDQRTNCYPTGKTKHGELPEWLLGLTTDDFESLNNLLKISRTWYFKLKYNIVKFYLKNFKSVSMLSNCPVWHFVTRSKKPPKLCIAVALCRESNVTMGSLQKGPIMRKEYLCRDVFVMIILSVILSSPVIAWIIFSKILIRKNNSSPTRGDINCLYQHQM